MGNSRCTTNPQATTAHGPVRGERRADGSLRFLGIPYARPPVGELRFAAPLPPEPWTEPLDATAYGPTAQRRPITEITTVPEPTVPGEGVLNLNVFTPDTAPETLLPVLVWIQGGGYVAGSAASPWYDGSAFNRDGVVVVSVGYRLGIEGFLHLDGAPDNRGVLDWIAALEWVRDNIAGFGGDPDKVTIAGQSAGGGAVLTLLAALHLAEAQVAGGGKAYLYELAWQSPGKGGLLRACHGLDGPLLFGTYGAHLGPVAIGPEHEAEARRLTSQIRTAWTSFATSGDPGWPAYDTEQRPTRIFDTTPSVSAYPEETSRRLWQAHTFEAMPLLTA
ncbi:carboxylesterase family protein [Streptomyces sp. NPDC002888]|uniref:carboxylesterase family protein n=1 Tax=Streptomyces sp. NPDC002888 TaxID=3364668 RepID=UPI0036A04F1E